jgi:hypothetical protein
MSKQDILLAKFELARCQLAKAKAKCLLAKAVAIEAYVKLESHKARSSL